MRIKNIRLKKTDHDTDDHQEVLSGQLIYGVPKGACICGVGVWLVKIYYIFGTRRRSHG